MEKQTQKTEPHIILGILAIVVLVSSPVLADATAFVNDFPGWSLAAESFDTIDFETDPDGNASQAGVDTPEFNYTDQGATFSTNAPDLILAGNQQTGFSLRGTGQFPLQVFIRADFVEPVNAAGIFFPGGTTLSVFDENDQLIASETHISSGSGLFLGFVADEPIAYAMVSRNGSLEDIESIHFSPIRRCNLTLDYVGSTLTLDFERATVDPVIWNVWLSIFNTTTSAWSVALPAIAEPANFPVVLPNFPSLGTVGVLTTLVTAEGIVCSNFEVVDTGTP